MVQRSRPCCDSLVMTGGNRRSDTRGGKGGLTPFGGPDGENQQDGAERRGRGPAAGECPPGGGGEIVGAAGAECGAPLLYCAFITECYVQERESGIPRDFSAIPDMCRNNRFLRGPGSGGEGRPDALVWLSAPVSAPGRFGGAWPPMGGVAVNRWGEVLRKVTIRGVRGGYGMPGCPDRAPAPPGWAPVAPGSGTGAARFGCLAGRRPGPYGEGPGQGRGAASRRRQVRRAVQTRLSCSSVMTIS